MSMRREHVGSALRLAGPGVALGLLAALVSLPVGAVIQRVYPLGDIIKDAQAIAVLRVSSAARGRSELVLGGPVARKGRFPAGKLVARVAADMPGQDAQLLARLKPGMRTVLFYSQVGAEQVVLGYSEGTWFRLTARAPRASWRFLHFEPFLRRSFSGSTAEMERIVQQVVAGRGKAPPPKPAEKPGIGPLPTERRGQNPYHRLDPGFVWDHFRGGPELDPRRVCEAPPDARRVDLGIWWGSRAIAMERLAPSRGW